LSASKLHVVWGFVFGVTFAGGIAVGMGLERGQGALRSMDVVPVRGVGPVVAEALPSAPSAMTTPASEPEQVSSEPPAKLGPARRVARAAALSTAYIRGNGVYGAGIVMNERYVLTCLHVVAEMKSIEISIGEGPLGAAEVVERDAELDLAVLRLVVPAPVVPRFASVTSVQVGDLLYAMGAPRKMSFSLSRGIASYVGRLYDGAYYLQTDIPTNGGSSGGPVLDEQARVVAISSFILRDAQGLSFALPIDYARRRFSEYFDIIEPSATDATFAEWLEMKSLDDDAHH
jgi:S1-C subfamily serine protease